VHPDLESLLALQAEDAEIHGLEERLRATEPRLKQLDRTREAAVGSVARARSALEGEERRHRELQARVSEHRQMHEKNVATLDQVRKMKEATAAVNQVERARRILADEEAELATIHRRMGELKEAASLREKEAGSLDEEQLTARATLASDRKTIEVELNEARSKREKVAQNVPRPLLAKYERIRTKRPAGAVFALLGASCGNCDTALPLHRRNLMLSTGVIEICEACGVLLYATK
jgi:predicted  nucleic acid-binding Zn-ribbon protein